MVFLNEMDRTWMYGSRESIEFVNGVSEFCRSALEYQTSSGAVDFYCPCLDCRNVSKSTFIVLVWIVEM